MRQLSTIDPDFWHALSAHLARRGEGGLDADIFDRVRDIVGSVRREGDAALLRWTRELDGYHVSDGRDLEVTRSARRAAVEMIGPLADDLRLAADRIRTFHRRQREAGWSFETEDGIRLGQRVHALGAVGLYVPGGTAAYPSSVLMNAVPAKVAGVAEVIMVTPTPRGGLHPAVLAAAEIAGVDRIFTVGGAQAVAALAYGTESVPRVDKIVGPGNRWVAEAKRQVFGVVDIDMIAGPSEVCVVATAAGGASAPMLAVDLLSQAEHDPRAMVCFISPEAELVREVVAHVAEVAATLPRSAIAEASVRDFGLAVTTRTLAEALEVAERIAPEHLELVVPGADALADAFRHAGAIFCGPSTPEAVGDYVAGPNHVLPTGGTARFASPLGVYDFVKRTNVIRFSRAGLEALGPVVERLAQSEGLSAHALSVAIRRES